MATCTCKNAGKCLKWVGPSRGIKRSAILFLHKCAVLLMDDGSAQSAHQNLHAIVLLVERSALPFRVKQELLQRRVAWLWQTRFSSIVRCLWRREERRSENLLGRHPKVWTKL
eukprot:scaffold1355_cov268-Pinguiococcus_pyrenoidosus.AAC.22